MTFASSQYLWGLLTISPALILFFWWSARVRQKLAAQFIQTRLLAGLVAGLSPVRQRIRAACLVAAVALLLIALARPQWNYDLEEIRQRGLDIVMAIDTSKSMLATDVAPNRLARAKLAALDLMQRAKFDRLGLVAFSGSAFLQCPLTIDDAVFRQSVEAIDTSTLPVGGTALAEAIQTALKAFKEQDNHKVLILFTDGEDHDSGALEAARLAARANLRIYTIGIGSVDGEILRVQGANGQSEYVRDSQGNVVKSRLNEGLLKQIAEATPNGEYFPLRANTIDVLYQERLASLPKSESREQWMKRPREQYHWFLGLAILLLLVESFLPERKPELKKATATAAKPALATAALVIVMLLPAAAFGSSSRALREYQSGKYGESLKEYEQLLQRKNGDPRLNFNAGAAAYREGQFDRAAKYFDGALTSPDLKMQEQAYYNKGNTLYRMGERQSDPAKKIEQWQLSLTNYNNSLRFNPQDPDTKFNYEFVNRKLQELREQQKQQQQQQQKNDPHQNQDQKQDNKDNQQSKPDSQQGQNQQNQNPNQQNQNPQSQPPDKKDQQAENPNQQPKPDQKPGEEKQPVNYAAGQMTPQEAKQLLDSQKNEEMLLPARPEEGKPKRGPIKDW